MTKNQLITEDGYKEYKLPEGFIGATHPETPQEMLKNNSDGDFFLLRNIVAKNVENIDWVKNMKLSPIELVGVIMHEYKNDGNFKQAMATKLPVNSKVFKVKESEMIFLVLVDGKLIRYLLASEGEEC